MPPNDLGLDPEQVELLVTIIDAHRAVPRGERQPFVIRQYPYKPGGPAELRHPGLPGKKVSTGFGIMADARMLERAGLVAFVHGDGGGRTLTFEPTAAGLSYYARLKQQGEPSTRVETELRRYVDSEPFRSAYPAAHQKWTQAEELLWGDDTEANLTAIGHHCREAMQEFADALVQEHRPEGVSADKAKTVERIRAVLAPRRSASVAAFLEALLAYWGTASDLVQRQEHGSQREGAPLTWEDARRVVFQTLVVMYEVDGALRQK